MGDVCEGEESFESRQATESATNETISTTDPPQREQPGRDRQVLTADQQPVSEGQEQGESRRRRSQWRH